MGHPVYVMMNPVLDFAVMESSPSHVLPSHIVAGSLRPPSTQMTCRSWVKDEALLLCPFQISPEVHYFVHMAQNLAHWCTATAISGCVDFSKKFAFPITDL
jgi:hypothetical protein